MPSIEVCGDQLLCGGQVFAVLVDAGPFISHSELATIVDGLESGLLFEDLADPTRCQECENIVGEHAPECTKSGTRKVEDDTPSAYSSACNDVLEAAAREANRTGLIKLSRLRKIIQELKEEPF